MTLTQPFANLSALRSFALQCSRFIRTARIPVRLRLDVRYQHGPDSQRRENIPHGKIADHEWKESKVFTNTIRRYSIYVPAQYEASKPAALMVFQDGHTYLKEDGDFRVPIVFDNLIAGQEMPVTIGVFIDPGFKRTSFPPGDRGWRPEPENRSFEYDTLSPAYSEFLLNEILPEVRKSWNITSDPEGHAICGISSGAICAWTVAWNRPDQFRKVIQPCGQLYKYSWGRQISGSDPRGRSQANPDFCAGRGQRQPQPAS